ncbi:MAG TPA: hypothetical protein VEA99_16660 [Gemmatimonadaceae bacterium]|nr:hypothetical protein [Gemmatimonadaceae bacterium]
MRPVWTLLKIIIALLVAIPVAVLTLGLAFATLGALIGLAAVALKLGVVLLVGVGAVKLVGRLFRSPRQRVRPAEAQYLPPPDPHYEAAMRELNQELGHAH